MISGIDWFFFEFDCLGVNRDVVSVVEEGFFLVEVGIGDIGDSVLVDDNGMFVFVNCVE